MAVNNRIYYAIEQIGVTSDLSAVKFNTLHGVQSINSDVTFNTENILELGQIDTYTSMENQPDVSMTIEKVFDGYPLTYWLATASTDIISSGTLTLGGRTKNPCKLGLALFSDYLTVASGTPAATIIISGAYINQMDYNLVIDGNFTESVGFVGNDRVWSASDWFDYDFDGTNTPLNASGDVLRRWHVDMVNSEWPLDIRGISASGVNNESGSTYSAHLQSVRISTSLNRTDLFELGRKAPYYKYANFPVDVTTAIETTATDGDWKDVYANQRNLENQTIDIQVGDDADNHRIRFYLGIKNKLTSINFGGGDTGGGALTITYNYTNQNTLTVVGDDDPVSAGVTI